MIFNLTYFLNKRNADVPNALGQTDIDYERSAGGFQREVLTETRIERRCQGLRSLFGS